MPIRPTERLNRSQLSVPATSLRFLEKAATSAADVILIDLEDSAPADRKASARDTAVRALSQFDWGGRTVSVRINAWDTPWTFRDLLALTDKACDRLDQVMLPKVSGPADVHALDILLAQMEAEAGRSRPIGLELLIESAEGLARIEEIAAASPRIEALHFGPGDYAASTGARTVAIGEQDPAYPGDLWHYPLSRILVAARANGLRAIDGPFARHADLEGLRAASDRAAALGFDGKWAIHPSQIEAVNAAFSPSQDDVAQADRILQAMATARSEGRAAVTLDGRMIDVASIRQAEGVAARAARIAGA